MKRVYRDKKASVDTLDSRQEQRALLVPVINRLSTARFRSSNGLHKIYLVRASEELFKTVVFDALEGTRAGCVLTHRRPAPTRPLCVWVLHSTSSVWIRKVLEICLMFRLTGYYISYASTKKKYSKNNTNLDIKMCSQPLSEYDDRDKLHLFAVFSSPNAYYGNLKWRLSTRIA